MREKEEDHAQSDPERRRQGFAMKRPTPEQELLTLNALVIVVLAAVIVERVLR